jgi:hypothetical protein
MGLSLKRDNMRIPRCMPAEMVSVQREESDYKALCAEKFWRFRALFALTLALTQRHTTILS